ncbi:hypothetical protein PR002_g21827 [Phytophthora rubi]|uniref:Uncharacterized protein n=1 Tax=Phytophthora rubi TaxID=129364 RepID=A0A6A3J1V2_9STRA|nr:hypothetical protein PR002_g21827 [Phytophthora rubi]
MPATSPRRVRVGLDRCSLLSDITAQQRQALLRLPVAREAPNPASDWVKMPLSASPNNQRTQLKRGRRPVLRFNPSS